LAKNTLDDGNDVEQKADSIDSIRTVQNELEELRAHSGESGHPFRRKAAA